jgi:hypothetical protein
MSCDKVECWIECGPYLQGDDEWYHYTQYAARVHAWCGIYVAWIGGTPCMKVRPVIPRTPYAAVPHGTLYREEAQFALTVPFACRDPFGRRLED